MDLDALTPAGTFVEFSWHSFDTDGELDNAWEAMEGTTRPVLFPDLPTPVLTNGADPAQEDPPS